MQGVVYLLCAATSLVCALLLLRGFIKTRLRLLLWCGFCFVGFAVDNAILFYDVIIAPQVDYSHWRRWSTLVGLSLLLYGMIWDGK